MRVLVACEESQIVTKRFRELGHEAYSCDILECSGGRPEWHLQQDVAPLLDQDWDLVIAFPPCTYLTVTGNRWFSIEKYGEKAIKRHRDREEAIDFFMMFANCKAPKVVIENPIGVMSTKWRKPDQVIQPYHFGDPERKATCLWVKGVEPLVHEEKNHVEPVIVKYKNGKGSSGRWHMETFNLPQKERSRARSKTFPGIAQAMAYQWGAYENEI